MAIYVTQTQKFLVRLALEVSGADERLCEPKLIDDMIRAMLVIEQGRMQAYMLNGFKWSCASRNRREPLAVSDDRDQLERSVDWFHQYIDNVRCEASRRIRANRARLAKEWEQYPRELHEDEDWEMDDRYPDRDDPMHADHANWDEAPRQLPVGHADEDAA
jgi:hypothetical protein